MAQDETPIDAYAPHIDRRTTLAWIGLVGAVGVGVGDGAAARPLRIGAQGDGQGDGYGRDPKLNPPLSAPWPRLLGRDELQTAAVVADFILPRTATAPSASQLGVPDFIDEWISAPYPDQMKDRPIIRGGLAAIRDDLFTGGADRRTRALAALTEGGDDVRKVFFLRFRALTVGAYYTTEAGFRDIGYVGNVARSTDPGPSDAVKAALQARLAGLGLSG